MTGTIEETYIVDLYRWNPCVVDATELVASASINTLGGGTPVCQTFTFESPDMKFDTTECLFFSVRQTTPGTGSAQARVDLRWTGVEAT